ncbi:uncharacterized protein [Physcomitrium patens]|uniref:uncharacterized protein isoform X4 n=1 Tax=Physcomitrium patens TaxID=3218 RepID=UPI003CCD2E5B
MVNVGQGSWVSVRKQSPHMTRLRRQHRRQQNRCFSRSCLYSTSEGVVLEEYKKYVDHGDFWRRLVYHLVN